MSDTCAFCEKAILAGARGDESLVEDEGKKFHQACWAKLIAWNS